MVTLSVSEAAVIMSAETAEVACVSVEATSVVSGGIKFISVGTVDLSDSVASVVSLVVKCVSLVEVQGVSTRVTDVSLEVAGVRGIRTSKRKAANKDGVPSTRFLAPSIVVASGRLLSYGTFWVTDATVLYC